MPSLGIVLSTALSHAADGRNKFSSSRSSASAPTEITGAPMAKSAQSGVNIHAGSAHVVSSGSRTKMYSPCRSLCIL